MTPRSRAVVTLAIALLILVLFPLATQSAPPYLRATHSVGARLA